jgi:hypothetical protein
MTPTPAMHLLGKSQPGWFGLTMHSAAGSVVARQVVVGDQRRDAELAGAGDALDAGDAVVDGDDQVGRALCGEVDDFRRQAVAVAKRLGTR